MERYSRKFRNFKDSDDPGDVRTFRHLLLAVIAIGAVGLIGMAVLTIGVISWLNDKTNDVKQAAGGVTQQVLSEGTPLNLDSYITDNQVNTEQLKDTFNALPGQLQDAWLNQFKSQIEELQAQAGIPAETIQTLTSLYNTLTGQTQ